MYCVRLHIYVVFDKFLYVKSARVIVRLNLMLGYNFYNTPHLLLATGMLIHTCIYL